MAGALLSTTACHDDDVVEQITGPTEVNLISCNILSDDSKQTGDMTWKKRRAAVLNMVSEENPDIMCMQGQLWNQVIYLDQQLPMYDIVDYNVNGNDAAAGLHNTIMYRADKYTVEEQGRFWLSQRPTAMSYPWASKDEQRRCASWALLKDVNTHAKFYVVSTFMNDGDEGVDMEARLNSAKLIVEQFKTRMLESGEVPLILAGDMNASNAADDARRDCLAPYYEWMSGARESAATSDSKPSYNALGKPANGARLTPDHIFVFKGEALAFKTLDGSYGVPYMSDHNPIYSKIKF